jgi:hypothetical protein
MIAVLAGLKMQDDCCFSHCLKSPEIAKRSQVWLVQEKNLERELCIKGEGTKP